MWFKVLSRRRKYYFQIFRKPYFTVCLPGMYINTGIFMQTEAVSLATRTSFGFCDKISNKIWQSTRQVLTGSLRASREHECCISEVLESNLGWGTRQTWRFVIFHNYLELITFSHTSTNSFQILSRLPWK